MKKILKVSIFLLLGLMLSSFMLPKNIVSVNAEEQAELRTKYSLIGASFNLENNYNSKYNISTSNVVDFTPFNLEAGVRFLGSSFKFNMTERNQILNQYIYVNNNQIPEDCYSLFVWVYFDSIYLHDLTIKLNLENGAEIKWLLDSATLVNFLKKTTNVNFLTQPFSWNKIELPFNIATITGEAFNGGYLNNISKLYVDFSSEEANIEDNDQNLDGGDVEDLLDVVYAKLLFNDIYISKSTNQDDYSVEKQNYAFHNFNLYSEEFIKSICLGDTIVFPNNYKSIVNYAWNGMDNLRDGNKATVSWRIMVSTPNSKNEYLYPSFGSSLTFDKEGLYQIYFQCLDASISNTTPIISDSVEINVKTLKPIYFDKSSYNLKVDKTYRLNVYTNEVFKNVSNIEFVTNNENLELNYNDNVLEVTAKKSGTYEIEIILEGERLIAGSNKEYKSTLKIEAHEEKENNNGTIKILLITTACLMLVSVIVVFVIKIIKNKKLDIR